MGLSIIVADRDDIADLEWSDEVSQVFVLEAPSDEDERIVEVQNWLRTNVPSFSYQYQVFSDWEEGEYATTMICVFMAEDRHHAEHFAEAWLSPERRLN